MSVTYGTSIKERLELLRVKSLQPHSAGNSQNFHKLVNQECTTGVMKLTSLDCKRFLSRFINTSRLLSQKIMKESFEDARNIKIAQINMKRSLKRKYIDSNISVQINLLYVLKNV